MPNTIDDIKLRIKQPGAMLKAVGKMMQTDVLNNFETEGASLGVRWQPLSKNYARKKTKAGKSNKMLISDGALLQSILASSPVINAAQGSVIITTNKEYARIQHLGGVIHRYAYGGTVHLRTDAQKNLLRQDGNTNLARFAKKAHKRVKSVQFEVEAFDIKIPARPYMRISDKGFENIKQAIAVWIIEGNAK